MDIDAAGKLMATSVREEVLRGAATPDEFSTQPTPALQAILRQTPTLPLDALLNRQGVQIDYADRRIWRDCFWKGSFAEDTLLGWEERMRTSGLGEAASGAAGLYAGGSFWKRFDSIQDNQATGYVVNYELDCLPGNPVVKRIPYPDNNRKYLRAGDDVLLLNYTNDPYKAVYDLIKVIDQNNCIGVMHLGEFPDGLEFSTFVMARQNYPFEKMSVPDHQAIFNGDHVRVPAPAELDGAWAGHVIFLTRPDISLLNQLNPVAYRMTFAPAPSGVEARYQFGIGGGEVKFTDQFAEILNPAGLQDKIRLIDDNTLIGKCVPGTAQWLSASAICAALDGYIGAQQDGFAFYYLLTRAV